MSQLSPKTAEYVQSAKAGIESLEYIDDLLREYMLFRGFKDTLKAFERDLERDRDHGFHADKIVAEVLAMACDLRIGALLEYWKYLTFRFFSHLNPKYQRTTKMFEKRLVRLFLASAARQNRRELIREFMAEHGPVLARQGGDWIPWLGLEYIDRPQARPEFEAYFGDEWLTSLRTALTDFMQTVFPAMAVPRILLFDKDRREKEMLKRKLGIYEEHLRGETKITARKQPGGGAVGLVENHIEAVAAATSPRLQPAAAAAVGDTDVCDSGPADMVSTDEPSSELRISQDDIFLEHNAGISHARFSASGELIASYDDESVLKVWAPDPASAAAKLKHELEFSVSALAWDQRHAHLLYMCDENTFIHTLNTNTNLLSRHSLLDKRHRCMQCVLPGAASSTLLTVSSARPDTSADTTVQLWDAGASRVAASQRLATSSPGARGVCAALNHNGTLVALAHTSGHVQVLDARSLETVATVETAQRDVCGVGFSLDESSLRVVTEVGALTQWSLRGRCLMTAESVLEIGATNGTLPADSRLDCDRVAFTPDRENVVVAPRDQCLIFNVDSAALADSTRRHKDLVSVIDVGADCLLSASEDGTVRVARYRKV
ncbi:hypothetical protein IWW55_002033 [Coemansia sp. RSA 2706]|nr:hypothetical protein LPJ70_000682 [Coemansia sp. RSA 2708]KAJ2305251.1 hypothetical protein IWW55_002033 [Coemansia sp. RSA 2706]